MQGAQTGSRSRGIGRYTMSFTQAMASNFGHHEIYLALSDLFPHTVEPIRVAFDGLLPQENIRLWCAPGPLNHIQSANHWRRGAAERIREAFLASLDPSVVVISSMFEGLGDDAVTSVGHLSRAVPTAAILYDLIPLIHRRRYLNDPVTAKWYENKLNHLQQADLLLSISNSTRRECIEHLGIDGDRIVNVSTAAGPEFRVLHVDVDRQVAISNRYGLERPFVMYTGGIDHRKNIEGLIGAYARLPSDLRVAHQLAVICSIQQHDRTRLQMLARQYGMSSNELVLTGYVPDDDLICLYNMCKVFVFPSWHEGFGLPALEAMSCGRAVIGANTSSLPEVIGCDEALFDPFSSAAIESKLKQVLTCQRFRETLERHAVKQSKKFSWDRSAQLAMEALEALMSRHRPATKSTSVLSGRRRMAIVTPLPPERSGISYYNAELIPELARHYDVEVVVAQQTVTTPWSSSEYPIHDVEWFSAHAPEFERVLYHFGNSTFHLHMFSLLDKFPGVVVLHDFFLSGIIAHMEILGIVPGCWTKALYRGHGYTAVKNRFHDADIEGLKWRYPCNYEVLQNAVGVIVHSEHACRLAFQWYGAQTRRNFAQIPLLRVPTTQEKQRRRNAREILGLGDHDFVICSFGMLGPTKLNHCLLEAWLGSPLRHDPHCCLIFVGENYHGEYGVQLQNVIRRSKCARRIIITGWTEMDKFRHYLSAADVGVQLRTLSRGETSAAVLDCMNNGLATIVNANGSMADLPDEGVWKLPDKFTEFQLADALMTLWRDVDRRQALGKRARQIVRALHAPDACADHCYTVIERFYAKSVTTIPALIDAIAGLDSKQHDTSMLMAMAIGIDRSISPPLVQRQLLIDISDFVHSKGNGDIQRMFSNVLQEWLLHPPKEYRVEPVYAMKLHGYFYARRFTMKFLGCQADLLQDEPISYRAGDVFIGPDPQCEIVPALVNYYQAMRRHGVRLRFVLYDMLHSNRNNTKISSEDLCNSIS